jgi:exonuclease III
MVNLNIWTLNCQGLLNSVKQVPLISLITKFLPSIVCLQETNINIYKNQSFVVNGYKSFYNSSTTNIGSGTIFLVKNNFTVLNDEILIPGKLQFLSIDIFNTIFYVFNIHFPFNNSDSNTFLNILNNKISTLPSQDNVILAGDFNFVENETLDRLRSVEPRKKMVKLFSSMCLNFNLFDSYRHLDPSGQAMTFFSKLKNNSEARLDRMYVNSSQIPNLLSCKMFPFISDHVIFNIVLKLDHNLTFKNLWSFPNQLLSNDNFIFSISYILDQFILDSDYTDIKYTLLKQKITQIAMEIHAHTLKKFNLLIKQTQISIQNLSTDQNMTNSDVFKVFIDTLDSKFSNYSVCNDYPKRKITSSDSQISIVDSFPDLNSNDKINLISTFF